MCAKCLKNFTLFICWHVCMSVKIGVIFGVQFERRKVDIKANLHGNRNMQTLFWSHLSIFVKYHQNRSL